MTLVFSTPPQTNSFVGRLDPRWKLAALLLAAAVAATLRTLPAAFLALFAALLLARLARLPARWFLERLAAVSFFLALFVLPLPFLLADNDPAWTWGFLHVSQHGIEIALSLCARAIAVVTLFLVLQASAPLEATLKAARSLRIPGRLVQLCLLTYRYVFVLAEELGRLRIALRIRGYRNRVSRHSYRTAGHVAGTLLVRGTERAERVAQAMRCRGFKGQFRSLNSFYTRPADVFAFLVVAVFAVALAAWDWLPRFIG